MANEKITVFFDAKGDKRLVKAINSLAKAQGRLGTTTRQNAKYTGVGARATKNAAASTQLLGGTLSVVRSKLLVYGFAIALVNKSLGAFARLAMKQEDAEKRLALQYGKSTKALLEHASALQKVTAFGDENIMGVQLAMARYTQNEDTVKALTEATLDFAAATGTDLKSASDLVSKSFGSSTNALARYGVQAKGTAGSQARLESLTANLAEMYGGQATKIDTTSKALAQMKNALGDAGEKIGDLFLPMIKSMAQNTTEFVQNDLEPFIQELKKINISETVEKIKKNYPVILTNLGQLLQSIVQLVAIAGQNAASVFLVEMGKGFGEGSGIISDIFEQIFENLTTDLVLNLALFLGNLMEVNIRGIIFALSSAIDIAMAAIVGAVNGLIKQFNKMPGINIKPIEAYNMELTKALEEQWSFQRAISDLAQNTLNLVGLGDIDIDTTNYADIEKALGDIDEKTKQVIDSIIVLNNVVEGGDDGGGGNGDQESWLKKFLSGSLDEGLLENWSAYEQAVMGVANAYEKLMMQNIKQSKEEELAAAKSIRNERRRQKEIDTINEKYAKKERKAKEQMRLVKISEAISNTALAITKVAHNPFLATLVGITGALQIATIKAEKYQYGGIVGGRRHSQGGTLIEAEEGEFVMNRNAVDSIGIENLNRMNRTGTSGGITVSFNGNVVSDDFIENEAIPRIKEAVRRGADIGVS